MGSPIVNSLRDGVQRLWPFSGAQRIREEIEPLLQRFGLMPSPDTSGHDQMVRDANQSFQTQPMLHPEQPPVKAVRK